MNRLSLLLIVGLALPAHVSAQDAGADTLGTSSPVVPVDTVGGEVDAPAEGAPAAEQESTEVPSAEVEDQAEAVADAVEGDSTQAIVPTPPVLPPQLATESALPALFPAQHVAEQLREAMADPRNAAVWNGLDEVVATAGSQPDDAVESPMAAPAEDVPEQAVALQPAPPPPATRSELVLQVARERWARSTAALTQAAEGVRGRLGLEGAVDAKWLPALGLAGALGLLLLVWMARRAAALSRRLRSAPENKAVRTAQRLARRGVDTAEVARRTGLSREVIQLIEVMRARDARTRRSPSRKKEVA